MKNDKLKKYRKKIDVIDRKVVKAILKRNEIVKKIGKYKKKNNIEIKDEKREAEVIKSILKLIKTKKEKILLKAIYNKIFMYSKKEQKACSKRSK